jgi:hypothetical protein
VNAVGWNPDAHDSQLEELLRGIVLYASAHYGNENTVQSALQLFAQNPGEKKNSSKILIKVANITVDLRDTVYMIVAENGGDAEFDWFLER